jgi:hydrogenase nickel incorporation protein HypA/HybF
MEDITEVKIMIGELQSIEHEIIEFALDQLRTPRLKNAKFVIEAIPARFKCRVCNRDWGLEKEKLDKDTGEAIHFVPEMAHVYIKCPGCGSPDFEVAEGRGVWLASIKGRKKE